MRNRYPGTCYRCGERVEAGEGHFELVSASQRRKWDQPRLPKWLTQHADCAIKYRGTTVHHIYDPDQGEIRPPRFGPSDRTQEV